MTVENRIRSRLTIYFINREDGLERDAAKYCESQDFLNDEIQEQIEEFMRDWRSDDDEIALGHYIIRREAVSHIYYRE